MKCLIQYVHRVCISSLDARWDSNPSQSGNPGRRGTSRTNKEAGQGLVPGRVKIKIQHVLRSPLCIHLMSLHHLPAVNDEAWKPVCPAHKQPLQRKLSWRRTTPCEPAGVKKMGPGAWSQRPEPRSAPSHAPGADLKSGNAKTLKRRCLRGRHLVVQEGGDGVLVAGVAHTHCVLQSQVPHHFAVRFMSTSLPNQPSIAIRGRQHQVKLHTNGLRSADDSDINDNTRILRY